ncbi:MAG: amino acid ABC transporter substrate-binding protein [Burkholderiales bacterium]|nr:amino acid ABC transporter substrate-binding protein [Burkholderiales bacterium]
MLRIATLVLSALFAAGAVHAQALDGRLKKIAHSKTIRIAYRTDATPFSYADDNNAPAGFSIDLCKRVLNSIERQLGIQGLQTSWVPVTAQNRFDVVAKGQADMECGSSTVTLTRMKQVDFSSYIFVETTALMVKEASAYRSISDLSGKTIAVVAGTTNERAVNDQLKRRQLSATVLPFKTRDEAFAAVDEGRVEAFASDQLLLVGAAAKTKVSGSLRLLPDELSFEPYGIALPRGDAGFRLAVNTGLAQIYRSEEINEIFSRWFARLGRPPAILKAVYLLGAIPE